MSPESTVKSHNCWEKGEVRVGHRDCPPVVGDRDRPLVELQPGQAGRMRHLLLEGTIRQRLLDLGFTPGTLVRVVRRSPLGDPTAYAVRGSVIALRAREARRLLVSLEPPAEMAKAAENRD